MLLLGGHARIATRCGHVFLSVLWELDGKAFQRRAAWGRAAMRETPTVSPHPAHVRRRVRFPDGVTVLHFVAVGGSRIVMLGLVSDIG